jgi:lipoprotein-releasing system permease protein
VSGAPLPLYVALRFLRSARRDAFTSFLSAVAAGGIGLGVAALVIALAALAGMQRLLRGEILERTPLLAVTLPGDADSLTIAARIAAHPGVEGVQRVVEGRGWLIAGGRAQPVRLLAYQGSPPRSLPGLAGAPPGLYLGDRLATRLGLAPGDLVDLASPRPGLTPLGPRPRLLSMRLAGTYRAGLADQDAVAALPLERGEILLGVGRPHRLFIDAASLDAALALEPHVARLLPAGGRVATWRDLNRPLFLALTLERTVLFLAVSLVVAVAAMALFSDLQLVAASKRRELALLAAMGADERALRRSFLLLGLLLGGGGAILGGVAGGIAAWALGRWELVRMPTGVLLFESLPFHVRGGDVAAVVGITLLLTFGCAGLGAARAARTVPAEALRP